MVSPSSAASPPAPQPPKPQPSQQQQLQSYPAYEKNGLKITLTPKTSPAQAGVVQILARFTSTQSIENVNFQVAVPKVSYHLHISSSCREQADDPDTTTPNAGYVEHDSQSGINGNATDASARSCRCKLILTKDISPS
jgi:AP-1 complex subunit gamma-1